MNRGNQPEKEKTPKEKAIEIVPAIVAGILLLLGMYFTDETLKIIFCGLALVVGVGMYLFLLVREIITRRKNKRD